MKKRRVFDIDFPSEAPTPTASPDAETQLETRRGPMAAAISENADALRGRAAVEQEIRAENDRLAHKYVQLKENGLVVERIGIHEVHTKKLIRDRSAKYDNEIEDLKKSIQAIGLSNPIRVEEWNGEYELIQGFRRLTAFRELYHETNDNHFASIPAVIVQKGEGIDVLYRQMVDENLVRKDISFAEMAGLAIAYVKDDATAADTIDAAIQALFGSAGRQKRSYIRHFTTLIDVLGDVLRFPEIIPRALGLELAKIAADPERVGGLRAEIAKLAANTPQKEIDVLRAIVGQGGQKAPVPAGTKKKTSAKNTLNMVTPVGAVKCAAQNGKIELQMERDFTNVSRDKLEHAIGAFMAVLDADIKPKSK